MSEQISASDINDAMQRALKVFRDPLAAQKAGFAYIDPEIRERVLLDMARQLEEQADAYNRYIVEVVGIPLTADAIVAYGIRQAARYVRGQASDKAI